MSTSMRLVTAEELLHMNGTGRRELVRGEVREMAPSGFDHGAIIDNFQFLLSKHVREHDLGRVLGAETGFVLSRRPDTVRGADIAFVRAERIPAGARPVGFWEGGPDLAVEVISPSDTAEEVDEKVADYLDAGTLLVVVVRPKRKTVTLHRPGQNPIVLNEADTLDLGDVIVGFACRVGDVFA